MPCVTQARTAEDYRVEMGRWLRDLRLAADLTQEQFAERIGITVQSAVSAIEHGRRVPPPDRLLEFADAYGMDPRIFAAKLLRFTHPHAAALLLAPDPRKAFETVRMAVPLRARGGAVRKFEEEQSANLD